VEREINVYSLSIISHGSSNNFSKHTGRTPGKLCPERFLRYQEVSWTGRRETQNVCGKIRVPFMPRRKYNKEQALLEFLELEND